MLGITVNREELFSWEHFTVNNLTKVNYAFTASWFDYKIDYSNLAHSLYVNGTLLTGNTEYSKQNWVIGKCQIPSILENSHKCHVLGKTLSSVNIFIVFTKQPNSLKLRKYGELGEIFIKCRYNNEFASVDYNSLKQNQWVV